MGHRRHVDDTVGCGCSGTDRIAKVRLNDDLFLAAGFKDIKVAFSATDINLAVGNQG